MMSTVRYDFDHKIKIRHTVLHLIGKDAENSPSRHSFLASGVKQSMGIQVIEFQQNGGLRMDQVQNHVFEIQLMRDCS